MHSSSFLVIVKRFPSGRWRAQSVEQMPYGLGYLWAEARSRDGAVRELHFRYGQALHKGGWSHSREACMVHAQGATFRVVDEL
jgi:hypothetical protein